NAVAHREQEGFVAHGRKPKCGMRNAECGVSGGRSNRRATRARKFRIPHSAFRISFRPMSVQAIAWSPSGAVRIVDQRALPEARIERDLESAEAVAEAIRTLQVRGAPLIGIARSEERRVGKECRGRRGW